MTAPSNDDFSFRLGALRGPLSLQLWTGPEPAEAFAAELRRSVEELAAAGGGRLVLQIHDGGAHPSLRVANVRYLALPAGPELPPFIDLLLQLDRRERAAALATGRPGPARLLVLTAPTCPVCPAAVAVCNQLAALWPDLDLTVIDALRFPELAAGCRSVPTVIVDERRALVGPVTLEQLETVLAQRGAPGVLQADLASLVEAGRLGDAERLLAEPEGAAAFAGLFAAAPLSLRVGLLLLAEEVLADEPCCLDGALPYLLPMQAAGDPAHRGDLADLLGRIGSPAALQRLRSMLDDPHPEVREAVREALAARGGPN